MDHDRHRHSATDPLASVDTRPAEWLHLPPDRIVAVEHPCVVNNIDNGLKSLGGEHHIKHVGSSPASYFLLSFLIECDLLSCWLLLAKLYLLVCLFVHMIPLRRDSCHAKSTSKTFCSESPSQRGLAVSEKEVLMNPLPFMMSETTRHNTLFQPSLILARSKLRICSRVSVIMKADI